MAKPTCVIVGVGPGLGEAAARQFAEKHYQLALIARSPEFIEKLAEELPDCHAFVCDVTDEQQVQSLGQQILDQLGAPETLIYNAGQGQWGNIEQTNAQDMESAWKVNTFGLFNVSNVFVPALKQKQSNLVVVGATASLRGGANFTAFASAKAAQRSLAQSMARHLWPLGVHVSYLIIDGVMDTPRTRHMLPDKNDDFFLRPREIAESIYAITRQPRSAWTFEWDVRPFGEAW